MNTLYRYLGIVERPLDPQKYEISKNIILDSASQKDRESLGWSLTYVDSIWLKYSIEKNDGPLQVMEVALNTPKNIEEIAKLIQRTVKYRILFVFVYEDRYLVMSRNFKITDSTGYVYTNSASCCTDWIYGEELVPDVLYSYSASGDVLSNVSALNRSIIDSGSISYRRFTDWFRSHTVGQKINLSDVTDIAVARDAVYMDDESVLFDKNQLSFICADLTNSYFVNEMGRTGRDPRRYFEDMKELATFEQEQEFMSDCYMLRNSRNYDDCYDFCDYRTTESDSDGELIWICQSMCSRVAV